MVPALWRSACAWGGIYAARGSNSSCCLRRNACCCLTLIAIANLHHTVTTCCGWADPPRAPPRPCHPHCTSTTTRAHRRAADVDITQSHLDALFDVLQDQRPDVADDWARIVITASGVDGRLEGAVSELQGLLAKVLPGPKGAAAAASVTLQALVEERVAERLGQFGIMDIKQ